MKFEDVVEKIGSYDEKFEYDNGIVYIRKYSLPWAYTEYGFKPNGNLFYITAYDYDAKVLRKDIDVKEWMSYHK